MSDTPIELGQFRPVLIDYLIQRFGCARFARRVTAETLMRLRDSRILASVGNPEVYIMGYALSLALKRAALSASERLGS